MKNIRDILFEMLRASVFGSDARERFCNTAFSEAELEELYRLAKAHDLGHFVAYVLQNNSSFKAHPRAQEIEKNHLLAVFRRERLDWEYERICELLEKEKIAYIPLKGAVIRALYPESWMRTSCDIDILVKREDLERAVSLVKDCLSYTEKGPRLNHDVPLYSPKGIHFELHFCLREGIEPMDSVLETVWEHANPVKEGEYQYRMTEEFFLFHQIAHAAYHFISGGCGIRPFLDLFLFRQKASFDEEVLYAFLKQAKLMTFYYSATALAEVWFGEGEHTDITREMEEYLLGGGVYGNMDNHVAMKHSREQGKFRYLWHRVFMPYRSLCIYYPKLKERPLLYPLYQVRRWFRIVFGGSRKRAVQELMHNAEMDQTKVDRASLLRRDLGLD